MERNSTQDSLARQLIIACQGNLDAAKKVLAKVYDQQKKRPSRKRGDVVVVKVDGLTKSYKVGRNRVEALKKVSVDIYQGEFVAITGTSGSGKSTLLHMIGGLEKADEGEIEINGKKLSKMSDSSLSTFRNRTVGFVFQFFYLQPFLNLQTNIEVPAMFSRTKRSERNQRSTELAETVGLSERLKHLPRELSGGQMQRAAIARALQNSPQILLADEPTGNLDRTNALAIYELFRDIREKHGTTIIVVTHDLELADQADRVIKISDGAVI